MPSPFHQRLCRVLAALILWLGLWNTSPAAFGDWFHVEEHHHGYAHEHAAPDAHPAKDPHPQDPDDPGHHAIHHKLAELGLVPLAGNLQFPLVVTPPRFHPTFPPAWRSPILGGRERPPRTPAV